MLVGALCPTTAEKMKSCEGDSGLPNGWSLRSFDIKKSSVLADFRILRIAVTHQATFDFRGATSDHNIRSPRRL